MIFEFKLPDIGEGLVESEIIEYLVKPGDPVSLDQPVVKIENDKALTELPAPVSGTIKDLRYKAGDIAATGSVIMTIETYSLPETQAVKDEEIKVTEFSSSSIKESCEIPKKTASGRVKATPHTRKVARDLGIDINLVTGTGKGGRITDEDVKKQISGIAEGTSVREKDVKTTIISREPEIVPFRGIRRKTAQNLSRSWSTIPHVTHMDEADITDIMSDIKKVSAYKEYAGIKLTLLPFVIKIITNSLKIFPYFNSRLDEENEKVYLLKHFNIGFAVDTNSGLMVPVIKNADNLSILDTAGKISELAEKAGNRTISGDELKGGTFTITNVGAFGGQMATPIILHPQAAILGMMRAKLKPVVHNGEITQRLMLPLVVSFDHRLVDGVAAAKFLDSVIKQLEDPFRLFMELK